MQTRKLLTSPHVSPGLRDRSRIQVSGFTACNVRGVHDLGIRIWGFGDEALRT